MSNEHTCTHKCTHMKGLECFGGAQRQHCLWTVTKELQVQVCREGRTSITAEPTQPLHQSAVCAHPHWAILALGYSKPRRRKFPGSHPQHHRSNSGTTFLSKIRARQHRIQTMRARRCQNDYRGAMFHLFSPHRHQETGRVASSSWPPCVYEQQCEPWYPAQLHLVPRSK